MTLYHGSDHIIDTPAYPGPCARRDFGPGFYTTESLDLAKEWTCGDNRDGVVNTYQWDPAGLQILDLRDSKYSILHWLAAVTRHRGCVQHGAVSEQGAAYLQRHYVLDLTPFDAIVGYSADDSTFSIARDFLNGSISLETLTQVMQYGKVQMVLKSKNALRDSALWRHYLRQRRPTIPSGRPGIKRGERCTTGLPKRPMSGCTAPT